MTTLPTMNLSPFPQRHSDSPLSHSERSEESSALARNNLTMKQFKNALSKGLYPAPASSRSGAGFTLIELLIVITLIGILAVAVLSALNPIEQINKARDARARGDSAQLLNAIDRYFAANLVFPWTEFVTTPAYNNDSAFGAPAYVQGVGVCAATDPLNTAGDADDPGAGAGGCTAPGLLVVQDELKSAFASKSYFETGVGDSDAGKTLWVYKQKSDPSIYVCFKPSAKVNQDKADDTNSTLKYITFTDPTTIDTLVPIKQCNPGTDPADPGSDGVNWELDNPAEWCFMCVPE